MSLYSDVQQVRETIVERLITAWQITKANFGRPRTESTDADLPRAVVRLARLVPNGGTSTVSVTSWRALFEITLIDRVPKGLEEVEHLKLAKAQAARDALMTTSVFDGVAYLPQIEGYEFDEEIDSGKLWWYSVTIILSMLIDEKSLSV